MTTLPSDFAWATSFLHAAAGSGAGPADDVFRDAEAVPASPTTASSAAATSSSCLRRIDLKTPTTTFLLPDREPCPQLSSGRRCNRSAARMQVNSADLK